MSAFLSDPEYYIRTRIMRRIIKQIDRITKKKVK
jgi:hypothetical protein